METMSDKTLRAIVKAQGIKGCSRMSKDELNDAISSNGINLVKLRVRELCEMAKDCGIKGYRKMSRAELIEAILLDDCDFYLSDGVFRQIAKSSHIEGYKTMRRAELIEAISSESINLSVLGINVLRQIAEEGGIEGYRRMSRAERIEAIHPDPHSRVGDIEVSSREMLRLGIKLNLRK